MELKERIVIEDNISKFTGIELDWKWDSLMHVVETIKDEWGIENHHSCKESFHQSAS